MEREQELAYIFKNYPVVFYSAINTPEWAKILKYCIIKVEENSTLIYNPEEKECKLYGEV